jgi:sugar transferase (PEP-CTERM/EpsH1 system associated)
MEKRPLLYLTHRVPYPPDKGDRIRNWNILRFLAQRYTVWLGALTDEPISDEQEKVLRQHAARVEIASVGLGRWIRGFHSLLRGDSISEGIFWSPRLASVLTEWGREVRFHAVLVSASSLVPYLKLPVFSQTPLIVDLIDVDSQKWLDYAAKAAFPRSRLYALEGRRLRKVEKQLPEWTHVVLVVSESEHEIYRSFTDKGRIEILRNGVDLEYFHPIPTAIEPVCTFVGALDYLPNVDAACWFAAEIWPRLRAAQPNLTFRLVGRRPTRRVLNLARLGGIDVVGSVPDVRPWVAQSMVIVVPLRIARGVQNKVLEALAMGKACVVSPAAWAGVRAQPDRDLLVADSPDEWVTQVLRVLNEEELRTNLGTAGRRFVETHHSWEACLAPLERLLAECQDIGAGEPS